MIVSAVRRIYAGGFGRSEECVPRTVADVLGAKGIENGPFCFRDAGDWDFVAMERGDLEQGGG